ncbi:hypothetical protein HQQ81_05650 [Microbacteriaceae bacterium VKM Ac-2854]|nr:hypothetical protein [Microbacteriaceae bacterium VKM Ac-2854]
MADPEAPTTKALDWYVQALGEDKEFATESAAEAEALVAGFLVGAPGAVPTAIRARAVLEVGADLYFRKASRNGITSFEGLDVAPMRISRNPLAAAYDLFRPFLVMGL